MARVIRTICAFCLLLAATASHAAYPMRVKDARGKTILIKAKPQRIVSISPNNTEILFALGLANRVVGVTRACDYPPAARKKPKVGDVTISAEAVAARRPDLVLAHGFLNDDAIRKLERLKLTVFATDPKTLTEVIRDIRTIGRITARPKTADSIARKMERAIASVKASRAKKKPKRVLVVIQANPLWAAGPKTFVDEMLRIANARNIAHDARPGFNTFSRELAVSRNPELIIAGVASDARAILTSPIWKTTTAVKHSRVYVIPACLTVRAGPRLTDGLRGIADALDF